MRNLPMSSRKHNFNVQTWVAVHDFANVVQFLDDQDIYKGSSASEILRLLVRSVAEKNKCFRKEDVDIAVSYLQTKGFRLGQLSERRGNTLIGDMMSSLSMKEPETVDARAEELRKALES
jgi:hypothetical protein